MSKLKYHTHEDRMNVCVLVPPDPVEGGSGVSYSFSTVVWSSEMTRGAGNPKMVNTSRW